MAEPGKVSVYGLYGEEKPEDDLGFVHIEQISTRSSQHDWQIKPHTHHGMFQLLFLKKGDAETRVDRRLENLAAPAVVCLPGNVVHGFRFRPGAEGWVLTFGESIFADDPDPRTQALIEPLSLAPVLMQLTEASEQTGLIDSMLEKMHAEFNWPQLGRGAMFSWMIRIILVTVRRWQDENEAPVGTGTRKRRESFVKFRQLLESRYKAHWTVEHYADELGLSAARLNRLCRAVAGRPAGSLIQDRLILEAQRLLVYTNATSSMVADELGFQDPAYFSRFFKRRTGVSPMAFRSEAG
jgi:AraC family transcriptional activator of pobA